MKKSFIVLILWFFVPVYGFSSESHKVKNQEGPSDNKPQTSWSFKEYQEQRQKRQEKPNVPTRKPALFSVSGIILAFHHEPNKEETALILKKTSEEGLKRTKVLPSSLKLWVFEWDKPKSLMIADIICLNFPKTPSLKSCEPNYPVYPADSSSQGQSTNIMFPICFVTTDLSISNTSAICCCVPHIVSLLRSPRNSTFPLLA